MRLCEGAHIEALEGEMMNTTVCGEPVLGHAIRGTDGTIQFESGFETALFKALELSKVHPKVVFSVIELVEKPATESTSDTCYAERYRYLRERSPFDMLTVRQKRWNEQEEVWCYATMVGDALDHEIDECIGVPVDGVKP